MLWNIGEHYRYTKDIDWIRSIKDSILRACAYLFRWIERNEKEEFRAEGYYGMIDGKVADPEDPYHSYMLNGYAYLGLIRSAEVLEDLDNEESERINARATSLLKNIRRALEKNLRESPVIPLGNGRWCPAAPPWAENPRSGSAVCGGRVGFHSRDLYRKGWTHGADVSALAGSGGSQRALRGISSSVVLSSCCSRGTSCSASRTTALTRTHI